MKPALDKFLEISFPITLEADGIFFDLLLDKYSNSQVFREYLNISSEKTKELQQEYQGIRNNFEKEKNELLKGWEINDSLDERKNIEIKISNTVKNYSQKMAGIMTQHLSSEQKIKINQLLFVDYNPLAQPIQWGTTQRWFMNIHRSLLISCCFDRQCNEIVTFVNPLQPTLNGLNGHLKSTSQLRIIEPSHCFDEQNFKTLVWQILRSLSGLADD